MPSRYPEGNCEKYTFRATSKDCYRQKYFETADKVLNAIEEKNIEYIAIQNNWFSKTLKERILKRVGFSLDFIRRSTK